MIDRRRIVLIVNPVAGGGRGRRVLDAAVPLLRAHGIEPDVIVCDSPAEPAVAARAAAGKGNAVVVVAVGGDGHAAAVAGGLTGTDALLGLLPAGSANDYAASLGVPPRDVTRAVELLVRGRTAPVDTMAVETTVGERRFLNVVGAGFDAAVAYHAERIPLLRGSGRYVIAIARVLPGFAPATFRMSVDGQRHEFQAMMVAIANGSRYGGGMRVAPDARLDSGRLEICIVGDIGRLEFVRAFPRVFRGTHVTHPKVTMLSGRDIEIESDRQLGIIGDGEVWGHLPARIRLQRASLSVIIGGS